jgi:predicted GTPase
MSYGAGIMAARKYQAAMCIDPRPFAVGEIKETLVKYGHIKDLVPAMGYGEQQTKDLEATIRASGADSLINATPADLSRVIDVDLPVVRVSYELSEIGEPNIKTVLKGFLEKRR